MYYLPQEAANRSHDLRMAVATESNLLGRLSLEQRKKKQVKLAMADYARQIHQFSYNLTECPCKPQTGGEGPYLGF